MNVPDPVRPFRSADYLSSKTVIVPHDLWNEVPVPGSKRTTKVLVHRKGARVTPQEAESLGIPAIEAEAPPTLETK